VRLALRTAALAYLGALVLVPLGLILYRTFEDGLVAFWESITTPAAISAISLSLTIVAIVVPLNVVFGVLTALALARGRAGWLAPIVDLPFAVSPVIVGVALILFWGNDGWLGGALPVIFSLPGMVLATTFVTLPFVVREVEPVLRELGDEQEEAAATLGASRAQTFWRVTLPAITRRSVDLPLPLGPSSAVSEPLSTLIDTSSSATKSPKRLATWLTVIMPASSAARSSAAASPAPAPSARSRPRTRRTRCGRRDSARGRAA
jgi:ABC-type tungstate transport system substrate-binding protein